MSLRKKPARVPEKVPAHRRKGRHLPGPATSEGWERFRTAHPGNESSVKAEDVALRSLGEAPAQFQELLEELWKEFDPVGGVQEGLVIRLARAAWLTKRADRNLSRLDWEIGAC